MCMSVSPKSWGCARVGGGRDGLSRTQGAPGLPAYVGRRGFRRSFPRLAVGGAMFRVGFLVVHLFGHATPVVGDDEPDLGFEREDILRLHTGRKYWPGEEEPFDFKSIFYDLPQEFRKEAAAGITDAIALPADIFNRFSRRRINLLTEEEWNGKKDDRLTPENEIDYMEVPYAAFDFFHLHVARGARLEEQPEQDGVEPVMFNEAACRKFGRTTSVG